jgi:hypothetical protein
MKQMFGREVAALAAATAAARRSGCSMIAAAIRSGWELRSNPDLIRE